MGCWRMAPGIPYRSGSSLGVASAVLVSLAVPVWRSPETTVFVCSEDAGAFAIPFLSVVLLTDGAASLDFSVPGILTLDTVASASMSLGVICTAGVFLWRGLSSLSDKATIPSVDSVGSVGLLGEPGAGGAGGESVGLSAADSGDWAGALIRLTSCSLRCPFSEGVVLGDLDERFGEGFIKTPCSGDTSHNGNLGLNY